MLTRRRFLHRVAATGGLLAAGQPRGWAGQEDAAAAPNLALALARELNRVQFDDLPELAVEHAKMVVASTLASAARGSVLEPSNIIRDLALEHGGRPDATVWFDGTRLPVHEVARVNAMMSDAAASDDSDIRNTAHYGTALVSVGMAMAERTAATGRDLLLAIATGYEAAGRLGEARAGGRGGIHASQIVGFAGAVAGGRLLDLTDRTDGPCHRSSGLHDGGAGDRHVQLGAAVHGSECGVFGRLLRVGGQGRLHRQRERSGTARRLDSAFMGAVTPRP